MNFSLLDKIEAAENGVLATVLHTEGHTYKKRGAKALFVLGEPAPVWGNLGSLCVDQELVRQGRESLADGKPRRVEIDTTEAEDVDFGYGVYCGGVMRILVEAITEAHKPVYRELRKCLAERRRTFLVHELDTGGIRLDETEPKPSEDLFVEAFDPLQPLFVFGATPLTRRLLQHLDDTGFEPHVIDWRSDYLDGFRDLDGVTLHLDEYTFEADAFVLIQSHHFRRDKELLKDALAKGCPYVGMLSSRSRRDEMYRELRREGVSGEDLDRVSSPVGIDIGGRSDPEIAIAIAAELVRFHNR
jgi:xanthine dehydrogenase accessory factor